MEPKLRSPASKNLALPELKGSGGNQKTVLVVDHDESIRDLAADVLRAPNRRIIEAADGDKALEQLDRTRVDIVIADNDLPGFPGNKFFEGVKHASAGTKILATTRDPAFSQADLKASPADDWIKKPFEIEELVAKVNQLEKLGRQKV